MSILKDLKWRYAVKKFDANRKIPAEKLDELLEALSLTPSSYGLQPWKFVVVASEKLKRQLLLYSYDQYQVMEASHLIVLARNKKFSQKNIDKYIELMSKVRGEALTDLNDFKNILYQFLEGKEKTGRINEWMEKQVYLALGNLLNVASNLKIDACPMEGFVKEKYDEILQLNKYGVSSVVICPIGYRSAEDKYSKSAKVRYSTDEVVIRV